jgi:hypothetical protein
VSNGIGLLGVIILIVLTWIKRKEIIQKKGYKFLIFSLFFWFLCLIPAILFTFDNSTMTQNEQTPISSNQENSQTVETAAAAGEQEDSNAEPEGIYSIDKPVPDSYLKNYLSFMDEYYNQLKDRVYSGKQLEESDWSLMLSQSNQKGWEMYHNITYVTNVQKEDSKMFDKRTDVAEAWSLLTSLSMDYDSYLRGTYKDIKKEEKEYEAAYNKAMKHFK